MADRRKRRHLGKIRRPPAGAPPGTFAIDPSAPAPKLRTIVYGPGKIEQRDLAVTELAPAAPGSVTWLDVLGLGDAKVLSHIAKVYGFHPLAMEDVAHAYQRPKLEAYGDYVYLVLRMPSIETPAESEQLSVFLGKNFVVTFQENEGDCFGPVRERLKVPSGRLRCSGADYLAYALVDAIVDQYFPILEGYGDRFDNIEDDIIMTGGHSAVPRLIELKRELLLLRRAVWPLRDALNNLTDSDIGLIAPETRTYFRDCYDHVSQVLDILETEREMASSLVEMQLSMAGQRLNEVMKVLTIISTIFIPLSFVAGVYGMNFDPDVSPWNMPELRWYYGYPFALGVMAVMLVGMFAFFRKKGWL